MNAEITTLVERLRSPLETDVDRLRTDAAAMLEALAAAPPVGEAERLREALVRVRAHTSYVVLPEPQMGDLLRGLLASIERITVAALASPAPQPAETVTRRTGFNCPECGPCGVDGDGCCSTCGHDAEILPAAAPAPVEPPPAHWSVGCRDGWKAHNHQADGVCSRCGHVENAKE